MEWKPIETAPRDGTLIKLCWFDDSDGPFDVCDMRYGHIQRNRLFPGDVGMWVSEGGFTWNESMGAGPTHWAAK